MNFFDFFRRKKQTTIKEETNIEDISQTFDEKDLLIKKFDEAVWSSFCFQYNLFDKDKISIDFLNLLVDNPDLFSYLRNHYDLTPEIIEKIQNKTLRVIDIKKYDEKIFQFDIFSNEDKDILEIIRKKIQLLDKEYISFDYDDFEKYMHSKEIIEIKTSSFFANDDLLIFANDDLLIEKREVIPLDNKTISYDENSQIITSIEKDKVFSKDIFDFYYSGDIAIKEDTTLFLPYNLFLEWIKDEKKLDLLKKVQIVFKDDYDTFYEIRKNINFLDNYHSNLNSDKKNDKLIIKVNHLLYVIENSNLESELKDYYQYVVQKCYYSEEHEYHKEQIFLNISLEIKNEIDEAEIPLLTNQFNQLDILEKQKEIIPPNFSSDIFLNQFKNLDEKSAFDILIEIHRLNPDEQETVLSNKVVIHKLRELLQECSKDEYFYYERMMNMMKLEEFFKIFDVNFVHQYFKNNPYLCEYRLFYTILEKNINEAIPYFLSNDDYFKEFITDIKRYSFSNLEYPLLLQLLKKIESSNIDTNLSFLYSVSEVNQFKLLKENFSDDFLIEIIKKSNKNVQQFFYLDDKRFNYLYDKFNLSTLISEQYKISDDVVYKNEFFDKFKGTSLMEFRKNINKFSSYQPNIFLEEKIDKYEDDLISNYNVDSGLFIQYQYLLENIQILDDRNFIYNGIDFFYDKDVNKYCRKYINYGDDGNLFIKKKQEMISYLQKLSLLKLNEIVIDRLFKDNIYNVFLNLKEMLRFHKGLNNDEKILSEEQIDFYKTVLNFDKLDGKAVIEWYQKLKDKNVALMFYQDLQKVKNKAYDKIKENLFQPEEMIGSEDKDKSLKYGVRVFDLRDKEYTMLVRTISSSFQEQNSNRRDCYTLLSDENSSIYRQSPDNYTYGYSGFDNDCILHMFEGDAFSADFELDKLNIGNNQVNRIMTSRELVTNSHWYSEVQIVNKKIDNHDNLFETLKPSFLIVYDEINEKTLNEAKSKNIPICIISYNLNRELDGQISFDKKIDTYDIDESEKRKGRY